MNRSVIKSIAVILIALFCLGGCAEKEPLISDNGILHDAEQAMGSELQQARAKLLEECYTLLEVNDQLYSGIFRLLEYTEEYIQTDSWDSLLKARASASAALVGIRQLELPVFDLTAEEMDLLENADIEANAVQREFETLESVRTSKKDTATLFCYTLEDDVFLKASVEDAIPNMTAFYRDYFTLEYRYLCLFANYMMIQADAGDLWQQWTEQLPCMAACANSWYVETSDVERATNQLLDEMQAMQTRMNSFLGVSEYTLEIMQEAAETGDLASLRREINETSGVPGYFPIPGWLPDVTRFYLVTDPDTLDKRLVKSGEEVDSAPSTCYISCGAIPLEDVETYGMRLKEWGIASYSTWNESKDVWQLIAKSGTSTMMMEWTEDETRLYLAEPVGCLIPELCLIAMTME